MYNIFLEEVGKFVLFVFDSEVSGKLGEIVDEVAVGLQTAFSVYKMLANFAHSKGHSKRLLIHHEVVQTENRQARLQRRVKRHIYTLK